ncbi:MAG: putative Calponin homology domain [Streblomastix strix]|uniref:Putative Calponin homology domain n=1 Tax=Streblomastix strix TaxID=222440 RepID=A0A5J4UAZ8_9EUKA|nr:MAG: putative Calponin homology domain [Streblomastix strix]
MAENRYALETDQLNLIYEWVDTVHLSRSKKNISLDFSDTMLYAEVAHHFLPEIVEVHNYPATSTMSKKIDNWNTFIQKVGKKISLTLTVQDVDNLANAKPGVIEWALLQLKNAVEAYQAKKAKEKEEKGEESEQQEEEQKQTSGIGTPVKSAKSANIVNFFGAAAVNQTEDTYTSERDKYVDIVNRDLMTIQTPLGVNKGVDATNDIEKTKLLGNIGGIKQQTDDKNNNNEGN